MPNLSFDIFWRDHGAKKGMQDLADGSDKSGKKMKGMNDNAKAGAIAAGVAILAVGKQSIDMASDISESQSKVKVVFGDSAQSVLDFGDTSAKSLGISKASALEAAGTFGNLFVSLKLPQGEAAKMSTKMITLAADMASFNNASPEEALEAIRSGLVGETEPLRKFGVNMNDATLREQAMKMGLVDNIKEGLTPAIKAQAAYGLMLAQTGTAQGDFARTSGGMANQQRILKARFADLEGELGAKLLPVVNKVAQGLLAGMDAFEKNEKVIIPLVVAVTGLATAVWAVNKATKAVTATQAAWTTVQAVCTRGTETQTAATVRLSAALKTVGPAVAVLAVAMGAVWAGDKIGKWQTATVNVNDMTKAMEANANQAQISNQEIELFSRKGLFGLGKQTLTTEEALKSFGRSAYNALDDGWDARLGRWQNLGASESKFEKQTRSLDEAFAAMVREGHVAAASTEMARYEGAARSFGVPMDKLKAMFPKYKEAVDSAAAAQKAATGTTKTNTGAVKDNTEALATNAAALLKTRGSEVAFEAAVDDARAALKENGRTLDVHTAKGRANRTALDNLAGSTLAYRDAAKEAGKSTKAQTAIMEHGRAELVRVGVRMGLTKGQARAYAREILGIPRRVSSDITLSLKNNIPQTLYGIKIGSGSYGRGLGVNKATGGPIFGPGTETSDDIPALLSRNEHVWTAREVHAAGGHNAVAALRQSVLGRGPAVAQFAAGGPVFGNQLSSGLTQIARSTSAIAAKVIQQTAAKALESVLGSATLAGGGWQRQWAAVKSHFPWAALTSSFRPGARTVSGNQSYHALGRAIDVSPSMDIFNWLLSTYGRTSKEIIFSPAGNRQIKNGQPHYYTGAVRAMHFNHVHWAYDQGGVATDEGPIWKGSKPERVLSATQTRSFDRLVKVLDRTTVAGSSASVGSMDIDYGRLGDAVVKSFVTAGVSVNLDGRAVGRIQGARTNRTVRGG